MPNDRRIWYLVNSLDRIIWNSLLTEVAFVQDIVENRIPKVRYLHLDN